MDNCAKWGLGPGRPRILGVWLLFSYDHHTHSKRTSTCLNRAQSQRKERYLLSPVFWCPMMILPSGTSCLSRLSHGRRWTHRWTLSETPYLPIFITFKRTILILLVRRRRSLLRWTQRILYPRTRWAGLLWLRSSCYSCSNWNYHPRNSHAGSPWRQRTANSRTHCSRAEEIQIPWGNCGIICRKSSTKRIERCCSMREFEI